MSSKKDNPRVLLQSYLDRTFPGSNIDTEHSIGGSAYLRFELGGEKRNGTVARVNQSVKRASTIVKDIFEEQELDVFVLVYDYSVDNGGFSGYVYQQFPDSRFNSFYKGVETVNSRFLSSGAGAGTFEKIKAKVMVGVLPYEEIAIANLIRGIANSEMGFEPCIGQRVFLFNTVRDIIFQMYDDRGCFVISNSPEKIRSIYDKRKEWLVGFDRTEIDRLFQ